MNPLNRRQFLQHLGVSAATLPFLAGLPSLNATVSAQRPKRLVIMFSPNGTLPTEFWPDEEGENFQFKSLLQPLEPFKKQTLILKASSTKSVAMGTATCGA